MSASRVGNADGMDVDDSGIAPPRNEWMKAAQRAADTDGILENAPAKRQKVCAIFMLHSHSRFTDTVLLMRSC